MDELTEYLTTSGEDGFWEQIQAEARRESEHEPMLVGFLFSAVLRHTTLEDGLAVLLANKLQTPELPAMLIRDLIHDALADDAPLRVAIRADLLAARTRDPAARGFAQPFLYSKGFHAWQAHRIAHWLWGHERYALAAHLRNRISEAFGVDVHPAARIGSGIIIDHGTSVVIGETAVVEDNVSIVSFRQACNFLNFADGRGGSAIRWPRAWRGKMHGSQCCEAAGHCDRSASKELRISPRFRSQMNPPRSLLVIATHHATTSSGDWPDFLTAGRTTCRHSSMS